jgi:hypothetical protein
MKDWLEYCRSTDTHPLAHAGLAMLQLLQIHPFEDGNGRTARAVFVDICRTRNTPDPLGPLALAGLYRFGGTALWAGSHAFMSSGSITTFWAQYARCIEAAVPKLEAWQQQVACIRASQESEPNLRLRKLVNVTEKLWLSVGGQLP